MIHSRAIAWYGALVAAFIASRAALLWRFPPHIDESLFAQWTERGLESPEQRFAPLAAGQHPMLEWLGMVVMRVGLEPLTAVRLVSVLAGLVTLGLVAHLGHELGGAWVGRVAALLWVVLPFGLVYSVIGLSDPLVATLVSAAAVLQLHFARRQTLGLALLLGLVLGVGLLTKLTVLVAVWLVPAGALVLDWSREGLARRLARWLGGLGAALVLAWGIYQVLQLSELADDLARARDTVLARHSLTAFLDHPGRWLERNWPPYRAALAGYLTLPGVVAGAVGLGVVIRRRDRLGLFIAAWGVLPVIAVVALADLPFVRWLLVAVPFLLVLAGLGLVEIAEVVRRAASSRTRGAVPTLATVAAVALLLLPAVGWNARTLAHPVTREYPGRDDLDYVRAYSAGGPWLELVPELRRRAHGRTLVVATRDGSGTYYVATALRKTHVRLVDENDEAATDATLGIENGASLRTGPAPLVWKPVTTWARPREGTPVRLLERGVAAPGGIATSPDALRAAIGGTDEDYDAFVEANPAVRAWLDAWYTVHVQ